MIIKENIKIQNIFHMLAYAFKALKNHGFEKIACEKFENAIELLASILIKGVELQIKRGLGKEYIPHEDALSTIRGKIEIASSLKSQTMHQKKLICTYDEFSVNTAFNQAIKATINILLQSNLQKKYKKRLKNLIIFFKDIDNINAKNIDWNIQFNRNNFQYEMLLSICYLIIHGLLQKNDKGHIKLQNFFDEQKLHTLYEKFILEYYRKHFPQLKVSSSQITWKVDSACEFMPLLPKMQSDIMISYKEKVLIIDAKFYFKTLQYGQFNSKKIHSSNLYQIFTYVKNHDVNNDGNVFGMLLYAKTDEDFVPNAQFNICGNTIFVRTLDLDTDFFNIKMQLDNIVTKILLYDV